MNCKFCDQLCVIENPGVKNIVVARCNKCPYVVKHFYYVDGQGPEDILDYLFIVSYKGKKWLFNFCLNREDGPDPATFDLTNADEPRMDPVVMLNFIPDITPYNALEKLPTLINFS